MLVSQYALAQYKEKPIICFNATNENGMKVKAISYDGQAVITWVDTNTIANVVYYMYRHRTGNAKELIYFAQAVPTPIPIEIMNSYSDINPCGDDVVYELYKVYNNDNGLTLWRRIDVKITCELSISHME